MGSPKIQSRLTLREKLVTLIDRRNPEIGPDRLVEDFVGHVRRNTRRAMPERRSGEDHGAATQSLQTIGQVHVSLY